MGEKTADQRSFLVSGEVRMDNIILIGRPGSGKSAAGRGPAETVEAVKDALATQRVNRNR